jgi:hypothetical protein
MLLQMAYLCAYDSVELLLIHETISVFCFLVVLVFRLSCHIALDINVFFTVLYRISVPIVPHFP